MLLQCSHLRPLRAVSTSRPSRRSLAVRAQGGYSNDVGIHAQVWVGDWSKDEAVRAVLGSKAAGYDLIERESDSHAPLFQSISTLCLLRSAYLLALKLVTCYLVVFDRRLQQESNHSWLNMQR